MTTDRDAPKAGASRGPGQDPQAQREAKLAEALRANLRRRKADPGRAPRDVALKPGSGDSG